jgi:phage terminase large subunit
MTDEPRAVWPPDYVPVFAWRQQEILKLRGNPELLIGAKEYYRTRCEQFIMDWVDTYDPRNAGKPGMLTRMPFLMFPRQKEMLRFLQAMLDGEEDGLIEKCRDAGATWLCVAFTVWLWLFWPGVAIGWGSRKEIYVDKLGVVDSIFEKIRQVIKGLPPEFLPVGFNPKDHLSYMRIINPENGSTVTGEAGDNIGRGGRTRIYFKDESAHYERPELVEAALGDNTRCQIDISSVNGVGNVFHRKREAGEEWDGGEAIKNKTNVFVFDWRDHPAKTQAWYDARKKKFEDAGLSHIFAQEVDRDYSSSVEGIIIKPEWVQAAIDAHIKLGISPTGKRIIGLDIADEGLDKNALTSRKGILIDFCESWNAPDVGVSARKAIQLSPTNESVELFYDCIGVGAGVKSEANRLKAEKKLPANIAFHPWNASAKVLFPEKNILPGDKDSPLNKDHYANLKAQAWSVVATRFLKTWQAVTLGYSIDPDDIVALDSSMKNLHSLVRELSQATASLSSSTMKVVVNKSPDGTKSPNLADSAIMSLFPVRRSSYSLENVG